MINKKRLNILLYVLSAWLFVAWVLSGYVHPVSDSPLGPFALSLMIVPLAPVVVGLCAIGAIVVIGGSLWAVGYGMVCIYRWLYDREDA